MLDSNSNLLSSGKFPTWFWAGRQNEEEEPLDVHCSSKASKLLAVFPSSTEDGGAPVRAEIEKTWIVKNVSSRSTVPRG